MARTKQKVRDEWAERKLTGAATTAETSGAEDAEADGGGEEGEEEEPEYEIEEIIAKRIGARKKVEFEVKWKGFEETTWEPLAHLHDTAAYEEWMKNAKEDDEEDANEGESDDDEEPVVKRGGNKRKRAKDDDDDDEDSDEEYKDSGDDSDEEEDSDEEYVPEGRAERGFGGRSSSSKPQKAKPLNERQIRLLTEELDEASAACVRATLSDLVRDHPGVYADVRALLKKHSGGGSEDAEEEGDED